MDALLGPETSLSRSEPPMSVMADGRMVSPLEFERLLVSHRRMVRVDRRADKLRGLQDLDTGELFFTDERRLLRAR
jgi:hypothetical protein